MFVNLRNCVLGLLVAGATASPITTDLATLEKRQNLPNGVAIFKCTVPGTIALTFDDGPHIYTESALNQLDAAGMKGTFFLNGKNYGELKNYVPLLKRMRADRHQIGSHTWDHPYLTQLSDAAVRKQMTDFETELRRLIGYYPTYMRAPYFDYNAKTLAVMKALGYRVIHADLDTNDWKLDVPASIAAFKAGVANNRLVLAHDVHETTVKTLLPQMIKEVQRLKLKAVTVGECLGEPYAYWYKVSPRA
ncbi:hypothetical protein ACHAQA_003582 [Verticillium albo-atrum]